ncbi:MAG: AraC family transcriptional regulator [Acidobacteriota bacterium]
MTDRSERDPLSDVLDSLRLQASIHEHSRECRNVLPDTIERVTVHLIGRDGLWLHRREDDPVQVAAGDLVVLSRDPWHAVAEGRDSTEWNDATPSASVLCGFFDFAAGSENPIVDALPELLVIPAGELDDPLAGLSGLLLAEAAGSRGGGRAIVNRLSEALFVLVLRWHVTHAVERRGVLFAFSDPRFQEVLAGLHGNPERAWRLGELAELAGMSRTSFSVAFKELLGLTPMQYLGRLRMQRAAERLVQDGVSVGEVATELGYETEAAFRRAFRRVLGVPPGAYRRGERTASDEP